MIWEEDHTFAYYISRRLLREHIKFITHKLQQQTKTNQL